MSVNPQTTGYLNWHTAGNGKGVRLCCLGEGVHVDTQFTRRPGDNTEKYRHIIYHGV